MAASTCKQKVGIVKISPLPPLHSLVAFESAMRLGSFTKAAAELNITQSAVSRQISQLEAFLGRSLFTREKGTVKATMAGEQYARQVTGLLNGVSDATSDVMKYSGESEITIACSSGVALLWLTPRLNSFKQAHPDIRIRMIVKDGLNTLTAAEFDVGIYYARRDTPLAFNARPLFEEEVFPICSPAYLGGRIVAPSELTNCCLLIHEDIQRQWMSWSDWLSAFNVKLDHTSDSVTSNQYTHLVQMAIYGAGVLLAWRHISDGLISQGLLVRATHESYSFGGAYHLVSPKERRQNRATRMFTDWVLDAAGQTQER